MMKVYEVRMEVLSSDWGRFEGWKTIGYYISKAKAEAEAEKAYTNRCKIVEGKTEILEHEVEE